MSAGKRQAKRLVEDTLTATMCTIDTLSYEWWKNLILDAHKIITSFLLLMLQYTGLLYGAHFVQIKIYAPIRH